MKNTYSIHAIEYKGQEYKIKLLPDGNAYIEISGTSPLLRSGNFTSWVYITTFGNPNTSATRAKLALKEYLKQQQR